MGAWTIAIALAAAVPAEPSIDERIEFIESHLGDSESALQWWYWGWVAGYSALTVGQAIPGFLADEIESDADTADALRASMLVGASTAAIGAILVGVSYPTGIGAPAVLAQMPEETEEQRAKKLAVAESLLEKSAEEEAFGSGWIAHAGNVAINLAAGMILWLGFDQLEDGLITFGTGWALGMVQILTQPTRAIDDWAEYRHRFDGGPSPEESALDWSIGLFPGGVGLVVTM